MQYFPVNYTTAPIRPPSPVATLLIMTCPRFQRIYSHMTFSPHERPHVSSKFPHVRFDHIRDGHLYFPCWRRSLLSVCTLKNTDYYFCDVQQIRKSIAYYQNTNVLNHHFKQYYLAVHEPLHEYRSHPLWRSPGAYQ